MLHVEASHEALKEMERRMRLSEEILRFMSVSVKEFDEGPCPLIGRTRERDEAEEGGDERFPGERARG
jgi:small subunit ribosomal protein S6